MLQQEVKMREAAEQQVPQCLLFESESPQVTDASAGGEMRWKPV
jgi:hypothetical protein